MEEKNMVIAVDGKEYDKDDCRKIKSQYWKIGDINEFESGHCYYINEKYYKYNTGYIVYDYRLKKYVIRNSMVLIENGVVGLDKEGKKILGAFSKDPDYIYDTFLYEDNISYLVLNDDIFEGSTLYKESLADGNFYRRDQIATEFLVLPQNCPSSYKNSLNYDSKNSLSDFSAKYEKFYNNEINPYVEKYGSFIKNYTFGVEFETVKGFVPRRITDKLGLIPLRDGSIAGLEYATIPLGGKKGLQTIIDTCKELDKRTTFDDSCALHVHMGGIPRTEKFFLALFKVLLSIEDEFYSMFPIYKKYNFGVKRKHYTKKFPINETLMLMDPIITDDNIKKNFAVLFKFLSANQNYSNYSYNLDNVHSHPSDPEGTSKWNIKSRYYWCNMIPLLFGNKKTVEFRVHTPTLSEDKLVNYLVICSSVLEYAVKYTDAILKNPANLSGLTLRDIIHDANMKQPSEFFDNIFDYIQQRKDYIYRTTKNDGIIADENNFTFYSNFRWGNTKTPQPRSIYGRKRSIYETIGLGHTTNAFINPEPVDHVNQDDAVQEALNEMFQEQLEND